MPAVALEWWQLSLLLIAGFVAGVLNTLAGGGSLITLPLMLWIGLHHRFSRPLWPAASFIRTIKLFYPLTSGRVKTPPDHVNTYWWDS